MNHSRSTKEVVVIAFFWLVTALMIFFALSRATGSHSAKNNNGQAAMYTEQGKSLDLESKIATYQGILENNPTNIKALIGLGDLYFDSRRFQEAIVLFLKASEIGAASVHVENDLGLLYLNTSAYDKALDRFQRALQVDPNHVDSLYYIGMIHLHKGESAKAQEIFEQIMDTNPPPGLAQKVRQQLSGIKSQKKPQ